MDKDKIFFEIKTRTYISMIDLTSGYAMKELSSFSEYL